MFASRSKVEELEERIEDLERRVGDLEFEKDSGVDLKFPDCPINPFANWAISPFRNVPYSGSDVYDEGADYKGRRSSNDLNDMGLG